MKRNKRDRKRMIAGGIAIFLALLMVLSSIAPFLLAAESSKIEITTQIGYTGLYKIGIPMPAEVEIVNNGSPIKGELLIKVPSIYDYEYITYAYPVEIEQNGSKLLNFEITVSTIVAAGDIKGELVDENGNMITQMDMNGIAVNPDIVMVASLSDNIGNLSYIRAIYAEEFMGTANSAAKKIISLDSDNFPKSLDSLKTFNVIYINDFDTSRLSSIQAETLKSWVSNGGILYIGTGENFDKVTRGLTGLISLESNFQILTDDLDYMFANIDFENAHTIENLKYDEHMETDELNFNDYSYEKTTSSPIILTDFAWDNSDFAAEEVNDFSLAKTLSIGSGKVIVCAFDFGSEIVSKSLRLSEYVRKLAISHVDGEAYANNQDSSKIPDPTYLNNMPAQDSDAVNVIYSMVLCYIIIIGPVLYIILKKKDIREKGFFIIPAFALTFMFIIFGLSYNTIFKKPIISILSRIEVYNEGDSLAIQNSNIAVQTAKKGDVNVEINSPRATPSLFSQNGDYYNYSYSPTYSSSYGTLSAIASKIKIVFGPKPQMIFYGNESWETNVFKSTEEVDLSGNIAANLYVENGKYKGTITNNTGIVLESIVLTFDKRSHVSIGSLKPGETIDITDRNIDNLSASLGESQLWDSYNNEQATNFERWRDQMRENLLYAQSNNNYYKYASAVYPSTINVTQGKSVSFSAFTSENLGDFSATVNKKAPEVFRNTIITMEIDCKEIFTDKYDLPFGYIAYNQIVADSYYDEYESEIYVYELNEIEFNYNFEKFDEVTLFQFSGQLNQSYYGNSIKAYIYNTNAGLWEDLHYKEYKNEPENYFDSEGNLRIKIDCKDMDYINKPLIRIKGGR